MFIRCDFHELIADASYSIHGGIQSMDQNDFGSLQMLMAHLLPYTNSIQSIQFISLALQEKVQTSYWHHQVMDEQKVPCHSSNFANHSAR